MRVAQGYLDDQLVLDGGLLNGDAVEHLDSAEHLLAQEVADVNGLAALNDGSVDGEVSIHCLHLVQETLQPTRQPVRADGSVRQRESVHR